MKYIFVNFSENNQHGCDLKCSFCEWSRLNYGVYYSPSNSDLQMLHDVFPNDKFWQISGGGDPLYHYEKNRSELKRIIDFAHSRGHRIELLTKKLDVALKYFDELNDLVDSWYFSVNETPSPMFLEFSKKVQGNVRVNLVLNHTSYEKLSIKKIKEIVDAYSPYVKRINLRENYLHPFLENNRYYDTEQQKRNKELIESLSPKVRFLSHLKLWILFNGSIIDNDYVNKYYLGFDYLDSGRVA